MDWSLVLASQSIEHVVDEEDGEFVLRVTPEDAARAATAIQTYEAENATVWRREIKWTGLLFDSRSVIWWFAVAAWFFVTDARSLVKQSGVFVASEFRAGEWWRAVTAVTLHADVPHVTLNCGIGFVFLGLAMGFYGAGRAFLAALLAGAAANATEILLRDDSFRSVGASGMVFGALGLLAAQSLFERHTSAREWLGRGVLAGTLLVVLLGFDMRSDIIAHVLGFGYGVVIGLPLCVLVAARKKRDWTDVLSGAFATALVVAAWGFALRR
jgi:rhomboid protease GluP